MDSGESKRANATDRHVGMMIRRRRKALGISQTELGDPIGITFQQVQKYGNGGNRISASRLQQVAHLLQVPVAYFFEGAPKPEFAKPVNASRISYRAAHAAEARV